ncbi:glutamine amidotransferase-like class 1 domain-containing protein 1 isoform X2 [Lytechinus variegatus]|uniref:glutamine amidotransferase-like class 1 domain-containing protein 1 isoform X2 n=1 Tax=Lytechinus variegatus TaxID=7654 RepID=UPI001BB19BCA|nr:glutamine amidotransferase-like class 1 domain-containing protein 1 isoform X2 [Lytechinus variegatus]
MAKPQCLLLLSSSSEGGIQAQSFIHAFTLAHSAFNVQITSKEGRLGDFVGNDENSKRWISDFRSKPYSMPLRLDAVEASRYAALLIPDCTGALYDLTKDRVLGAIIKHFVAEKKLICAIGSGVAALCSTKSSETKSSKWLFASYCLTAPSVYELARLSSFSSLPVILEDFIKDNAGKYTGKGNTLDYDSAVMYSRID